VSDPAPITTIVSDFGGVLTSPLWEAFEEVQDAMGIPADALEDALRHAAQATGANPLHALERGELAEDAFLALLGEGLEAGLGRPVRVDDFTQRYFAALRPNGALLARLAALREEGYRLGLLTNNVREWEPRWRAMLPVDELFEVVVDSAFVGMRKPERGIYELVCSRLEVAPEACVFLDDIEANAAAAEALGMAVVRWTDADAALAELDALLAMRGAPQLNAS
jgi:putative hydrolase of the HAD superfamily